MENIRTTKLEGLVVRRKATGEIFTITGKDECGFFLLNGGSENGGRDVMGSELNYYERVSDSPASCVQCGDKGFIEVPGNVWTKALYEDPRAAYAFRALNTSYRPCPCGAATKLHQDRPPRPRILAGVRTVAR
jgi:hypothetical protein